MVALLLFLRMGHNFLSVWAHVGTMAESPRGSGLSKDDGEGEYTTLWLNFELILCSTYESLLIYLAFPDICKSTSSYLILTA